MKPIKQGRQKTHPDGGWGWCVVVAAFLTQFVVTGLQNSSAVIFNELVEKFNKSRGETGFVSSISVGMMFLLGPLTTSLCQKYGCRKISVIGGLMCILGMVTSAFATSLTAMYISFGVMWGVGTSLCYFPTMIILVPYFSKRLPLVNGIVGSGSGFGTLVLSPLMQWFAKTYGIRNMFLMLAALHGVVFLAGFFYLPVKEKFQKRQGVEAPAKKETKLLSIIDEGETTSEKKKGLLDTEVGMLLRNKSFVVWCIALSVFILGYFVPFVHLIRYAKLAGIPEVQAAFLISILSIVTSIMKIVSGKIAGFRCINKLYMYQAALLLMGISTTLIPVCKTYASLTAYVIAFGIGESCFVIMIPLITKDIVGVKRLPLALGCVFMLMGVPTVVGAPIAGWLYDYFNDYAMSFYVAGSMNVFGVLLMFLVEYFRENKIDKQLQLGEGISCITKEHDKMFIEESIQRAETMTVEFTCFGSSQRIFYSEIETREVERFLSAHKFIHKPLVVNTPSKNPLVVNTGVSLHKLAMNNNKKENNKHAEKKLRFNIPQRPRLKRLSSSCHELSDIEEDRPKTGPHSVRKSIDPSSNRWSLLLPDSLQENADFKTLPSKNTADSEFELLTLSNGLSISFIDKIQENYRMQAGSMFTSRSMKTSGFFVIDSPSPSRRKGRYTDYGDV